MTPSPFPSPLRGEGKGEGILDYSIPARCKQVLFAICYQLSAICPRLYWAALTNPIGPVIMVFPPGEA
jgi:hypothetical protein